MNLRTDSTESETITRIIYRCQRCRQTVRVDYPTLVKRHYYAVMDQVFQAQRQGVRTEHVFILPDGRESFWLPPHLCPTCSRVMGRTAIEGRLNPNVKCSGRCTSATGPVCECACAGANHGGKWIKA